MPRYLSDQNRVVFIYESGTFGVNVGTGSAIMPWFAQSNDLTESENPITTRFLGNATRNIGRFDQGPVAFEGTLSYYPVDFRMVAYALGSVYTVSGTGIYQYNLSEVNSAARQSAFTSGTLNPFISDDSLCVISEKEPRFAYLKCFGMISG
mgnify:CR=1 FL=1